MGGSPVLDLTVHSLMPSGLPAQNNRREAMAMSRALT
jgi:hypothetical protein